jgi:hypothetical protein
MPANSWTQEVTWESQYIVGWSEIQSTSEGGDLGADPHPLGLLEGHGYK